MTDFQLIFSSSRTYGGRYAGDDLPANNWKWPEGWLERRRREIAVKEAREEKDNERQD